MLVVSYIRNAAYRQITPKIKEYFRKEPKIVKVFKDFNEFKDLIRKDFAVLKEPVITKEKI